MPSLITVMQIESGNSDTCDVIWRRWSGDTEKFHGSKVQLWKWCGGFEFVSNVKALAYGLTAILKKLCQSTIHITKYESEKRPDTARLKCLKSHDKHPSRILKPPPRHALFAG